MGKQRDCRKASRLMTVAAIMPLKKYDGIMY